MSWSKSYKGTPSEVIEQLVNAPVPNNLTSLQAVQFNSLRAPLIEHVKVVRDSGPSYTDGVLVNLYGHANDDGIASFGAGVSRVPLAPPPEPTPAPSTISPVSETTPEESAPAESETTPEPVENKSTADTGRGDTDPVE